MTEAVTIKLTVDSSSAEDNVRRFEQSMAKAEAATARLAVQQENLRRVFDPVGDAYRKMADAQMAQTRAAQQLTAANDNTQSSFVATGVQVLATTAHLKAALIAAYALSPAFRGMVNPAITQGLAAIGPAAVSAGSVAARALTPLLSFVTRIGGPVLAIAAAWQVLNAVIERGSGLLDKYGNAQRNLVAGVDENLTKLTKFQDSDVTAEQVRQATELGARLTEANRKIGEFFKVQFDLTVPALALQRAWVSIVEVIAKAVEQINKLIALIPQIPQIPGLDIMLKLGSMLPGPAGAPFGVARGLTASIPETAPSQAEALAAAYQRLGAAMGSTSNFAVRFGQAINDLANPPKQAAEAAKAATGEFERLAASIARANASQEADAKTVGRSVEEQVRLRTEFRLTEAAQQDIAKTGKGSLADYADRIKQVADRAAVAAGNVAKMQIASQIQFGKDTAFLSPQDVQIAQTLSKIYDNDIPKSLASTEAAAMRTTAAIRQISTASESAFTGMVGDIASGMNAMDSLIARTAALGKSLTDIGSKSVFDSLRSGLSSGTFSFDPVSIGAGVVGIGINTISNMLSAQKKADEALSQAKANFADMAKDVSPFNVGRQASKPPANDNKGKDDVSDQRPQAA